MTKFDVATWHTYLRHGIETGNDYEVERSIDALGRIRNPRSISAISAALAAGYHREAVHGLMRFLPDARAISMLEETLPHLWPEEFDEVVAALKRVRSSRLPDQLLLMLESGDPTQAECALEHLDVIGVRRLHRWCQARRSVSRQTPIQRQVLNRAQGHVAAVATVLREAHRASV